MKCFYVQRKEGRKKLPALSISPSRSAGTVSVCKLKGAVPPRRGITGPTNTAGIYVNARE